MRELDITFENFAVARAEVRIGPLLEKDGTLVGNGRILGRDFAIELRDECRGGVLRFEHGALSPHVVVAVVDALFVQLSTLASVEVRVPDRDAQVFRPNTFFQLPDSWHHRGDRYPRPHVLGSTGAVQHPVRPEPGAALLYRRYCAGIDKTLSFKSFSLDEHLDIFIRWMNDPEVDRFWEMAWEPARLEAYAKERIADPHAGPMIGYFDDVPFGYFESYWAKEDRLGPYYDAHDYDRGFHMAVGDARFRFRGYGRHWFLGMAHFLFLDDPRTMRLVGEPRVDQDRVRSWAKTTPWQIVKEFDFPHKRALLMMMSRDAFFESFRQ